MARSLVVHLEQSIMSIPINFMLFFFIYDVLFLRPSQLMQGYRRYRRRRYVLWLSYDSLFVFFKLQHRDCSSWM